MRFEELLKRSAEKAAKQAAEETAKRVTEEVTQEVTQKVTQKVTKETQDQILRLADYMIKAGEAEQISHLREDPDFLHAMLDKYHLLNSNDV